MHIRPTASSLVLPLFLLGAPAAAQDTTPAGPDLRRATRVTFRSTDDGALGQTSVDYGLVLWRPDLEKRWQAMRGRRWRLGRDQWTSLETNVDLSFVDGAGEPIEVAAGRYYLTLEHEADSDFRPGRYVLSLLDPAPIRAAQLDASHADRTRGGIKVPLHHEVLDPPAAELSIRLTAVDRQADPKKQQCMLQIRFGPHLLKGAVTMLDTAPAPLMADPGHALSAADRAVLEHADSFEIVSTKTEWSDATDADTHLLGYEVLDRKALADRGEQLRALSFFYAAFTENPGAAAHCFMPRHAIVARQGERTVTLLICFECLSWQGDSSGERIGGLLGNRVRDDVNAFWKERGLRIAR